MDEGVGALRLLALDLGERRIGLAFSDTAADWVFPAGYIQRTKLADLLRRILHEAQTRQVDAFVVGVPYGRDGEAGPQAEEEVSIIERDPGGYGDEEHGGGGGG